MSWATLGRITLLLTVLAFTTATSRRPPVKKPVPVPQCEAGQKACGDKCVPEAEECAEPTAK